MDGVLIQTEACPGFNSEQVDFHIARARRMRAEAMVGVLRTAGSWIARGVKFVFESVAAAHRRRMLTLQLDSMNDDRLKDIGLNRFDIDEFVNALEIKETANNGGGRNLCRVA